MTVQELEQLIEGQLENPNLDFKADCRWEDKEFAKDFLAMSNIRDGGRIVIGVKEDKGKFAPVGVSPANRATFKIDTMRDQLASFCDPSPEFRVDFPTDSAGREFVVITIAPFRDVPLLSRKGIPGLILANTIYYRNTNKRVESAPVSNSNDLRDMIELAARNLHRRRTDLGYHLQSGLEQLFEANLAALPETELLTKIKAAPHWMIEYQPADDQQIGKLQEIRERMEKATVRINWPFPYFSLQPGAAEGLKNGEGFVEGFVSQWYQFEFWRFYRSGHFLLLRMLRADAGLIPIPSPEKGTFVTLLDSIVHVVTETVQFLQRLVTGGLYASGVTLLMTMQNVGGRLLYLDDPRRSPLLSNRKADANTVRIYRVLSAAEITEDPLSISSAIILEVFDSFLFNPQLSFVRQLQDEYLQRKSG